MISLSELLNSKEFKEYYNNSSPEDKEKMNMAIHLASSRLQEYIDAIQKELWSRQHSNRRI